jgi:hypothetical protein
MFEELGQESRSCYAEGLQRLGDSRGVRSMNSISKRKGV